MEAFREHIQQTITKQKSFAQAVSVVAGAVAAIADSTQWPLNQRLQVLDQVSYIIQQAKDSISPVAHDGPTAVSSSVPDTQSISSVQSSPQPVLTPRSDTLYFKCMIFGDKGVGKSAWINLAKMALESSSHSTPLVTLESKEITCKSHSGQRIQYSLWEVPANKSIEEQEQLRKGSHATFVFYDSSSESSVRFAEVLISQWSSKPAVLILVDNRPPSGETRFQPRVKPAEYIIISIAKKGNIVAPLQLATRKILNDSLFSFELNVKQMEQNTSNNEQIVSGSSGNTGPNPAAIAAAAASTVSSSRMSTPQSWNAKKVASLAKAPVQTAAAPAQPLSAFSVWELETRSAVRRKHPNLSSKELDKVLVGMWRKLNDVEREKYGILALRAQRLFAQGLSRDLNIPTSPEPCSSDDDSW